MQDADEGKICHSMLSVTALTDIALVARYNRQLASSCMHSSSGVMKTVTFKKIKLFCEIICDYK